MSGPKAVVPEAIVPEAIVPEAIVPEAIVPKVVAPKVVVLCGGAPRHLYVANRLCQLADVRAIVTETGSTITAVKIWQQARKGLLWRKLWRKVRDRFRYVGNGEAVFFFGDQPPVLTHPELRFNVDQVNSPEVIGVLKREQPDVLVVFGTSLLGPELMAATNSPVVNLHGGLSPWYRGADCTFWALYHGEPDRVGCTLHFIDRGIDTGRLLAHVCPKFHPDDDELTLFWRGVRDSAEVYAELLPGVADGSIRGVPQREPGTLYQVRDRLWRHERRLRRAVGNGLIEHAEFTARISLFGEGWPQGGAVSLSETESEPDLAGVH